MTIRRVIPVLALAAAALVVALLVLRGGDEGGYEFSLRLDDALGLRSGSLVTQGGVRIGTVDVDLERKGGTDTALVTATLDPGQGPVGKDATAIVSSVNLLGQKRLELTKGNVGDPAPSGFTMRADRLTPSTDLDQVLAVLTPTTREQLKVLINEAGGTVAGRGTDLARLIDTLPPTLQEATKVVDEVTADTQTLASLVERSDRVVASVTRERRALGDLVDSAGTAAASAADKRAQIRATLDRAPRLLTTLQTFLGDLEATTRPLGPAARNLSATAPSLDRTLAELPSFQQAAQPTLRTARQVAPDLSRLARGATPVLKRATPTLQQTAAFAEDLKPLTDALNLSVHNIVGTIDNWSRAVQFRDGLSHIFRGEAAVTPQTLEGMLIRYRRFVEENLPVAARKRERREPEAPKPSSTPAAPSKPKPSQPKVPDLEALEELDKVVPGTLDKLDDTLDGRRPLLPTPTPGQSAPAPANPPQGLLDYLLK